MSELTFINASRWHMNHSAFLVGICISSFTFAATIPEINYRTNDGAENRKFIFVNNPEEIRAEDRFCDLSDDLKINGTTSCSKVLHRLTNISGVYRTWFEHTNKTNDTLNYGVRIYNPGPNCIDVTVTGKGSVINAIFSAGKEFVSLFSDRTPKSESLCATQQTYVFLEKNIPVRNFFTGVVDFEISGGTAVVDHLAFIDRPAPSTRYTGYDIRVVGRVHESLVYKGLSFDSEAEAKNVDFTFSDDDPNGRLKVAYKFFTPIIKDENDISEAGKCDLTQTPLCSGVAGYFTEQPIITDNWVTHITIDPFDNNPRRTRAVQTDNISLFTPGYSNGCLTNGLNTANCLEISGSYLHYYPDFSKWLYPNWANWGVVYTISGLLKNNGKKSRVFRLAIRPDAHTSIAYRDENRIWRQASLEKSITESQSFPYFSKVIEPGKTATYEAKIVLSGPASGTLENIATLNDN